MIDVMIIAYNESLNLPHCLAALKGWTRRVFVIDSGSTDGTVELAQKAGAEVVSHPWEGYARQKNWGLRNLPLEAEWVLLVDADEVITKRLRDRLSEIASRPVASVPENGFFINRLTMFMGSPIRHCGYFPGWNLRFFKRGKGRYEDREVHEHVIIEGTVGYIREPMIHDDRRGLEHYMAKHNRYSTLEARALFNEITREASDADQAHLSAETRRNRWLKRNVIPSLPFPGMWRFLYMYVLRLGVMDGWVGLQFCSFISMYDSLVALKLRDLKRQAALEKKQADSSAPGLAVAEGQLNVVMRTGAKTQAEAMTQGSAKTQAGEQSALVGATQMQPEASPWTFREKVGRAAWMVLGQPLFRVSFHNWYRFRASILRMFGAKIGSGVAIRPTVHVEVPWMLEIEDDATVGDYAILYCLGKIRIGARSIISQYAHLCAGTHDYTDHTFRLIRSNIDIGADVWIGADVFVGPGIKVGDLSVVGARSSAYKDLPARSVCVGNPAKAIKERVLR